MNYSKLLVNFVIALTLLILGTQDGLTQEKSTATEFKPQSYLSGGVGIFDPDDQEVKDVLGSFYKFGGGFCRDLSVNIQIGGAAAYMEKQSSNIEGYHDLKWTVLHIEGFGKYMFRGKSMDIFIGGGLCYFDAKETLTKSGSTISRTTIGPLVLSGVNIPINESKTTFIYIRGSWRSAETTDEGENTVSLGGKGIEAGLCFKI